MRDFYQEIIDIMSSGGEACCVIPIGDPAFENAAHTTVTTKGQGNLDGLVFTYSEARTGFDTPTIYIRNQFRTPLVTLNGTDEEADTPDAAEWSRDDGGGANGLSIGVLANITDTALTRALLAKWDATTGFQLREWFFGLDGGDSLELLLYDESANVSIIRKSDAAVTVGSQRLFVATYDGAGGASAADTVILYESGVVVASTATNSASYVGMENLTTLPMFGANLGPSSVTNLFNGEITVPFFTHRVLSAGEALNLNDIYVAMQRAQRNRMLAGVL